MEWTFSSDQLLETPSRKDGISLDQEALYREKTVWFIEELGKDLKWLVPMKDDSHIDNER
jgi:hypothetical protein